jgi:hypothetical protein
VSAQLEEQREFSPVRKVAGIAGFFMAVGPPVACLLLFIGVAVGGLVIAIFQGTLNFEAARALLMFALLGIAGMPYSYVFGIIPAGVAGLLIGALQVRYGRLNWLIVLAIGACVGIAYSVALKNVLQFRLVPPTIPPNETISEHGVDILLCVVTTFLCWRVVKHWYPQPNQSSLGRT